MKLIVQTSSGKYGVGLLASNGALLHYLHAAEEPFRSRSVGDLYGALMKSTKSDSSEITDVVVDLGPGGLSSTRCGVSFANAFAYAASVRLHGVSALELLMLDVRKICNLPLISMRPAPGGFVFWALYLEKRPKAFGCGLPIESVEKILNTYQEIAIAGPISRINADLSSLGGVHLYDVNPPGLDCFSAATLISPRNTPGIPILEPITSIEGLRYD